MTLEIRFQHNLSVPSNTLPALYNLPVSSVSFIFTALLIVHILSQTPYWTYTLYSTHTPYLYSYSITYPYSGPTSYSRPYILFFFKYCSKIHKAILTIFTCIIQLPTFFLPYPYFIPYLYFIPTHILYLIYTPYFTVFYTLTICSSLVILHTLLIFHTLLLYCTLLRLHTLLLTLTFQNPSLFFF